MSEDDDLLHDDALLRGAGAVAISFSLLESLLFAHTVSLIDATDHKIGRAVLARTDFIHVLETFYSLVLERLPSPLDHPNQEAQDLQARLRELVKRINAAREKRNRLLHSHWAATYRFGDPLESNTLYNVLSNALVRNENVALAHRHKRDTKHGYQRDSEFLDPG